jgi:predicted N-acetyltransferase YhbS
MAFTIRPAVPPEAPAIARLVNQAYEVERFFVLGDRTSAEDVVTHMRTGVFFVASEGAEPIGSVYVETRGDGGSFGMLAVDPLRQGAGVGGRLIEAAEQHVRGAGGRFMDIHVVNLRTDLLPRYRRLGYVETGTAPYVHRPTVQACHFVLMRKALQGTPYVRSGPCQYVAPGFSPASRPSRPPGTGTGPPVPISCTLDACVRELPR